MAEAGEILSKTNAEIKNSREEVKKWLAENKDSNTWEIKIKVGTNTGNIESSDPRGLHDYLKEKTKSFFQSLGTETTFIFEKNGDGKWKNVLTAEQITTWVKNTSDDKASLKLAEGDEPKELSKVNDLDKLFEDLFAKKNVFEALKSGSKKDILFEKDGNDWKHSKSEIDNWLIGQNEGNNKFEIKIKKEVAKDLNSADENDLIGLFNYLKGDQKLSKYKSQTENSKVVLTLKKNQNSWELIHDQNTINNWVSNTLGKKENLKLYEKGTEKFLSNITVDSELKQLFTNLVEHLKNDNETNGKIVVFEKYQLCNDGDSEPCNESWVHVKKAIEDFADKCDYTLWIQMEGQPSNRKKIEEIEKDDELIGMLNLLQNEENDDCEDLGDLILEKGTDSKWTKKWANASK